MRTKSYIRIGILTIVALASASCLAADSAAVDVDRIAGIHTAESPTPRVQAAAKQLKAGMKRLYGVELGEVRDLQDAAGDQAVFVLGKAALEAGLIKPEELARVRPGGYVIRCGDGRIAIAGNDGWSTFYGVLEFLERQGVRFFTRHASQAFVPEPKSRKIEPYVLHDKPVFAIRNGWSPVLRQYHAALGDPRKGLNPELFTRKAGSDLWVDHSAGYLVPKALYYDEHPEYYAMRKDGERIAKDAFTDHRTPLCLSNPDVTKISIERALAWIDLNPDKKYFQITYGDTGFWCQCPECLKHDPAPGEYASRLLECWVNPVARAVAEKYPGRILLTFAYAGSDKAPPKARPEKNVWVVVATGCGNFPFWDHAVSEGGKSLRANQKKIESWAEIAPGQVSVCEYLGAYEPAMIDKMTGRLRYYAGLGLRGVNATYGAPANFRPVFSYVWPKMGWDPRRDGLALAKEVIDFHYGPAAEPIFRFFELSHEQYQATLESGKELTDGHYPPDFYSPEFFRKALARFEEAVKAAGDDAKLKKEIESEMYLFLGDVIGHLPSYDLSDASNRLLLECLGRQRSLAERTGRKLAFLRSAQALAMKLENKRAGYRKLIGDWLGESPDMKPIEIPGGLRFTPEMFLWCDYGPGPFPGRAKSHPDFPCPPKVCAGVYMKTKDSRGNPTSHRMVVDFNLTSVPEDSAATLSIEGQDAISHWMGDRGKDWKTSIEILVNDKEIFSGECGFVRGNWSRREFAVPAGCLKKGENRLEFRNTSRRGWFAGCWFLLSDARLTFDKPEK